MFGLSKKEDLSIILANMFPTITFKLGMRQALKTDQASIEEVSPNRASQGNLYESKFFNIVSRSDLKTFDSRRSNITFNNFPYTPDMVLNKYVDGVLTSTGSTYELSTKSLGTQSCVCYMESQASVSSESIGFGQYQPTITSGTFKMNISDAYSHIIRFYPIKHINDGVIAQCVFANPYTMVQSGGVYYNFDKDEHAPVDDDRTKAWENENYNHILKNADFNSLTIVNSEDLETNMLEYLKPISNYITMKNSVDGAGSFTTTSTTPTLTLTITFAHDYAEKVVLTCARTNIKTITFTTARAGSLYFNGVESVCTAGTNTVTGAAAATITIETANPYENVLTDVSVVEHLNEVPYYVQIIESRTQGNLYSYLIEARYI